MTDKYCFCCYPCEFCEIDFQCTTTTTTTDELAFLFHTFEGHCISQANKLILSQLYLI